MDADSDPHRLTDRAVLSSLVTTLRGQIVPALTDKWARSAAIQLAALAAMLRDRPPDPGPARAEELRAVLAEIGRPADDAASYADVLGAVRDVLVSVEEADPARVRLRQVLIGHLDDDLAVEMPLLAAFRGQVPDA
jgi:hypothetical protein